MSTVLAQPRLGSTASHRAAWLAIVAGLLALYVPTYVDLARGLWREDAYAHGPIVLAVFAWLVWRSRDALAGRVEAAETIAGAVSFAFGLVLFAVGRSQSLAARPHRAAARFHRADRARCQHAACRVPRDGHGARGRGSLAGIAAWRRGDGGIPPLARARDRDRSHDFQMGSRTPGLRTAGAG